MASSGGDSGIFYFSEPGRADLLAKIVNGCEMNERFWVFAAATTDVEYTLTVTDTANGQTRTYENPLGGPAEPILDTSAFATCP